MKRILFLILLLSTISTNAQNLVINPSFEEYDNCPSDDGQIYEFGYSGPISVTEWYRPSLGSSDYFNECAPASSLVSIPTAWGAMNAKEGNGIVGSLGSNWKNNYLEYFSGHLSVSLIEGHEIYGGYWMAPTYAHAFGVGGQRHYGMLFTNDVYYFEGGAGAPDTPQIISPPEYAYLDTLVWINFGGVFTANGGEEWITIGNFPTEPETVTSPIFGVSFYTYYDNMCVIDMDGSPGAVALHDKFICGDNSLELNIPDSRVYPKWNNNDTAFRQSVTTPGKYWARSIDPESCTLHVDTFRVGVVMPPTSVQLGNDTAICPGVLFELDVQHDSLSAYKWNTGDTTASIIVATPGRYYVTANSACHKYADTIVISDVPPPEVALPNDTLVCNGTPIELSYHQQGNHCYWSTGSEECCIVIDEPGTYSLTLTNVCGDSDTDEITITHSGCDHCILIPTAFSPNGDGLNDKFEIYVNCLMKEYKLSIFNRWGQLVFSAVQPDKHWNGLVNGKPADLGVYFYYIEATPAIEGLEKILKKGDVTLIR